ncbi:MAG: 50S ribosomal protein L18, partial [Candidatus Orphnella occulta]|nr:50S ribosomal protein L18 [Candidatus Orphnella occulta]
MQKKSIRQREIRHKRARKKIIGTDQRPRLCVYRSLKNLSAQVINDV